jgi:hypothetical protein
LTCDDFTLGMGLGLKYRLSGARLSVPIESLMASTKGGVKPSETVALHLSIAI